jgi:predicted PurR-regulated permease PerM
MKPYSKYIIGFVVISLLVFFAWYFDTLFIYICVSTVLTIIGLPIVNWLKTIKFGSFSLPDWLISFSVVLFFWLIIAGILLLLIPYVAQETENISNIEEEQIMNTLSEPISHLKSILPDGENISLKSYVVDKISSFVGFSEITTSLQGIFSVIGDIFIGFFAISFITFFFLKDTYQIKRFVMVFIPDDSHKKFENAIESIKKLLSRYFTGLFIQLCAIFVLVTIGMMLVGFSFSIAMLIGMFAGLFNIIPYLGPIMGGAFAMILAFIENLNYDFYSQTLPLMGYILLVIVIVQVLDNIIFQPLIFSNSVYAHPLEIFLVVLIAATVAGIGGMIVAIPGYIVIRVIAKEFLQEFRIIKKLTENI